MKGGQANTRKAVGREEYWEGADRGRCGGGGDRDAYPLDGTHQRGSEGCIRVWVERGPRGLEGMQGGSWGGCRRRVGVGYNQGSRMGKWVRERGRTGGKGSAAQQRPPCDLPRCYLPTSLLSPQRGRRGGPAQPRRQWRASRRVGQPAGAGGGRGRRPRTGTAGSQRATETAALALVVGGVSLFWERWERWERAGWATASQVAPKALATADRISVLDAIITLWLWLNLVLTGRACRVTYDDGASRISTESFSTSTLWGDTFVCQSDEVRPAPSLAQPPPPPSTSPFIPAPPNLSRE